MSFRFYWMSRGKEKHLRVDASSEQEARERFKAYHPRAKVTRVEDVTRIVSKGISCW